MTDTARQAIVDKITALSGIGFCNHLHYDTERREAFLLKDIPGVRRRYLSDIHPDSIDTSHWNAMVEWENANTLLAIYDEEGPDAAMLWRLSL